jgi:hypothetical protein
MNNPLRFLLVRSRVRMIVVTMIPPPPHPVSARPRRKTVRLGAAAVIKRPIDKTTQEKRTYTRGVNI